MHTTRGWIKADNKEVKYTIIFPDPSSLLCKSDLQKPIMILRNTQKPVVRIMYSLSETLR